MTRVMIRIPALRDSAARQDWGWAGLTLISGSTGTGVLR